MLQLSRESFMQRNLFLIWIIIISSCMNEWMVFYLACTYALLIIHLYRKLASTGLFACGISHVKTRRNEYKSNKMKETGGTTFDITIIIYISLLAYKEITRYISGYDFAIARLLLTSLWKYEVSDQWNELEISLTYSWHILKREADGNRVI